MRDWILGIAAVSLALGARPAHAAPLPQAAADILDAAAADPETLESVVKAVKKANPSSIAEIDAQVAALSARPEVKQAQQDAGLIDGWTGKGEFGASMSTGNTEDQGFSVALGLERQTPLWGHDLNLTVDHKREDEKTTKDRYFGAYSLQRKLTPRLYAVGVLWAERDRFAGYNYRFSESVGLGYRLFDRPDLKLRVEAGGALRQSEYLVRGREDAVAARLAGFLNWRLTPTVDFSQSLVTYLDSSNSTLLSNTALTTKLQGRFSVRASYEVRHEENPPEDRDPTDTTARVTLVVDF